MIKACVIGCPIAHSRSPLIHNFWLQQYGINGSYEAISVPPEGLETFLKNLGHQGYVGCNVTLPHKETALPFVDHPDQSVLTIGSLNTVYLRNGETHATSTDGEGFMLNLLAHHPLFNFDQKNIIILGAGGSAKALTEIILRSKIASLTIVNRTLSRAQSLKVAFEGPIAISKQETLGQILPQTDLVINTTSLGMAGQAENPIDLKRLPPHAIVADIVYVPLKTQLLKNAEARGLRIVPGLGMLLHQATRGFELWFDQKPKVTKALYDLVAHNIDPDYLL